ncbi:MAG: type II toxin-antitoxin system RelE/ParE family toxin [Candidatus Gorgyraea atricola]|nr:type II toxin-antitoxin system RelE/ParE family toxin [Candidatus Gorgyraea atricola]
MYKIAYTKEAKERIDKLDKKKKRQIKEAVERIAQNPEIGKQLLHEFKGLSSYRSGDYRVIYRVYHQEILILILTIGHRKDIYKLLKRKLA